MRRQALSLAGGTEAPDDQRKIKTMVTIKIADDVREVISKSTTTGKVLTLPAGLDRKLYVSTNKVLEALGGKWNKKQNGHVFDDDASKVLKIALGKEGVVDKKKTYQVFETPDATADRVAARFMEQLWTMSLPKRILEPSAGTGQLLAGIERWCNGAAVKPPIVHVVEIQKELLDKLGERPLQMQIWTSIGDFLEMVPRDLSNSKFDGVIMNPPFTKGQDIAHVMHAMQFVKPRGVLTAVMSPAWQTSQTSKAKLFREWLKQFPDVDVLELQEGSFKDAGTNVRTVVVTIQKGDR